MGARHTFHLMLFKNIPILLAAALAPAPLFAADYEVTPDQSLDLSDIEIDSQPTPNTFIIYNLNIAVQNPNETAQSTIERSDTPISSLSLRESNLNLNQGVLNINNDNQMSLSFLGGFELGSELSSATVKTNGNLNFNFSGVSGPDSKIVNTDLHIQSYSVQLINNSTPSANFSTIKVYAYASFVLGTNAVHRSANLHIDRNLLVSSSASLAGNNSSQAGFISDSTLSNLNIEHAAITHTSHLTLDNVVLTDSTLTANNLTLVQRDVDASQTLSIDTVASISGDLTLNVYLADIASLGVDFSFSADGITGLIDSNLAINFYDSLTNEIYATGTDFTLNSGVYTSSVEFIPEPSTATLSLLALAGLLARRRRKAA